MHIDPFFGMIGAGLSLLLQVATLTYPRYLLSKLEYNETTQEMTAYAHGIPTVFQSTIGTVYPLGIISIDAASATAKEFVDLQDLFRGPASLTIKKSGIPFVIDVQEHDVFDHRRLLPILMTPEEVVHVANNRSRRSSTPKKGDTTGTTVPVTSMKKRTQRR